MVSKTSDQANNSFSTFSLIPLFSLSLSLSDTSPQPLSLCFHSYLSSSSHHYLYPFFSLLFFLTQVWGKRVNVVTSPPLTPKQPHLASLSFHTTHIALFIIPHGHIVHTVHTHRQEKRRMEWRKEQETGRRRKGRKGDEASTSAAPLFLYFHVGYINCSRHVRQNMLSVAQYTHLKQGKKKGIKKGKRNSLSLFAFDNATCTSSMTILIFYWFRFWLHYEVTENVNGCCRSSMLLPLDSNVCNPLWWFLPISFMILQNSCVLVCNLLSLLLSLARTFRHKCNNQQIVVVFVRL